MILPPSSFQPSPSLDSPCKTAKFNIQNSKVQNRVDSSTKNAVEQLSEYEINGKTMENNGQNNGNNNGKTTNRSVTKQTEKVTNITENVTAIT